MSPRMNRKDADETFETLVAIVNNKESHLFSRKMAYALLVAFGNVIGKEHSFYTQKEVLAVLQIIDELNSEELI